MYTKSPDLTPVFKKRGRGSSTNEAEQTIISYQMLHFEEILIAVLIGAIAILTFVYAQKKRYAACACLVTSFPGQSRHVAICSTTRKGSSQKTRRPKILANVLEEIESRCVYNERIKRAASHNPPNVVEAENILAEMVKNGISPMWFTWCGAVG